MINQAKAVEWGLSFQQAALFSCLYELQAWGKQQIIDGQVFYWAGKNKIVEECPLVFDKPDSLKRHFIALENAGLIERRVFKNLPYLRITELGKQWNKQAADMGESAPEQVVKKITTSDGESCKKSRPSREKDHDLSREKNHDNKNISNKNTNIHKEINAKPALDFSSWPAKPSEQVLKDWLAVRRAKKAPFTQTVINRLAKHLNQAAKHGVSVDDCLAQCAVRGWVGFEFSWLVNAGAVAGRQLAIPEHGNNQSAVDDGFPEWEGA